MVVAVVVAVAAVVAVGEEEAKVREDRLLSKYPWMTGNQPHQAPLRNVVNNN